MKWGPCGGPITNEETDLKDKNACACAACGVAVPVDAEELAAIRRADAMKSASAKP